MASCGFIWEEDPGSNLVFPTLFESIYRKRWKKYCESNGITYISPYEIRHTFVSVVKNIPGEKVKQIVGHSANMDTFGVYGHALHSEDVEIVESVGEAFSAILGKSVF